MTQTTTKIEQAVSLTSMTHDFPIHLWMIDELHLTGTNLILFAYIFAQSLDVAHPGTTSLKVLSAITGLSKQTLSRALDKLPYVVKNVSQDNDKGFYVYNYYRIDVHKLLRFLKSLNKDIYREFINSFRQLLIERHIGDANDVESHFDNLSVNNSTVNSSDSAKFTEMRTLQDLLTVDINNMSFKEVVQTLNKLHDNNSSLVALLVGLLAGSDSTKFEVNKNVEPVKINNESIDNNTSDKAINDVSATELETKHKHKAIFRAKDRLEPLTKVKSAQKDKTRQASRSLLNDRKQSSSDKEKQLRRDKRMNERNEAIQPYKDAALNFVLTNCDNNQELLNLLYNHIETCVFNTKTGKSSRLNLFQYQEQLKIFAKYQYVDDMLESVRYCIANSYSSMVMEQPWSIEKKNRQRDLELSIPKVIDDFVAKYDNNETLKDLLSKYSSKLQQSRGIDADQFRGRLATLEKSGMTTQQLIAEVENTYIHGYLSWSFEYGNNLGTKHSPFQNMDLCLPENSYPSKTSVVSTVEERERAIDDMWKKYYLYMNTDLKEALLKYVREVPAGCAKTYQEVCECIDNLVHRRFTDSDMLSAVTTAIDNNYPELCRKDFEKEEKLKKQFRTIQEFVDCVTEERRRLCRQSRRIQDDPKFAGMPE